MVESERETEGRHNLWYQRVILGSAQHRGMDLCSLLSNHGSEEFSFISLNNILPFASTLQKCVREAFNLTSSERHRIFDHFLI